MHTSTNRWGSWHTHLGISLVYSQSNEMILGPVCSVCFLFCYLLLWLWYWTCIICHCRCFSLKIQMLALLFLCFALFILLWVKELGFYLNDFHLWFLHINIFMYVCGCVLLFWLLWGFLKGITRNLYLPQIPLKSFHK